MSGASRRTDSACRLGQRRPRREQVVHEHHPAAPEQPTPTGRDLQRTCQIHLPRPGPEPRLVRHRASLPQHRGHPCRSPPAPQLRRGGQCDPPRGIVAARSRGPPRRRYGHQQQGPHVTRLPRPGPHSARQGPAECPCEPECPSLLVGQQHRAYRVLVRRRGVDHGESRRLGIGPHTPRTCGQRRGTLLAQLRTRPAAATAGHRQDQPGDLPPPSPHGPTVPWPRTPGQTCGQRLWTTGTGPGAAGTPPGPRGQPG